MAQKRIQYVKTETGQEKQYIGSHSTIVDIDTIEGLEADNLQEALVELTDLASTGGVTSVNGKTGAVTLSKSDLSLGNVTNDAQVKRSEMGKANGVATLDSSGKVPSSQLPSYVDDIVEIAVVETDAQGRITKIAYHVNGSLTEMPATSSVIYLHSVLGTWGYEPTDKIYRWGGGYLVEISPSIALGETSSTAYAGDKGKANADAINTLNGLVGGHTTSLTNILNGTSKVGKAGSADKLTTGRKISLTGDATGEITFDGTADKEISVSLSNTGIAVDPTSGTRTYSVLTVDGKGRATAGAQLVEWGTSTQTTPSANLAVGGLFFQLVE